MLNHVKGSAFLVAVDRAKSCTVPLISAGSDWVIAAKDQPMHAAQDLVEALSDESAWHIPVKHDQAAYQRNTDGSFKGYELVPPFHYHDGW